jgi:hypothetical protein
MKLGTLFFPLVLAVASPTAGCTVTTPPVETQVAYVGTQPPPPPPAHYVRGHWEHRGRTTVWVDGHWV